MDFGLLPKGDRLARQTKRALVMSGIGYLAAIPVLMLTLYVFGVRGLALLLPLVVLPLAVADLYRARYAPDRASASRHS